MTGPRGLSRLRRLSAYTAAGAIIASTAPTPAASFELDQVLSAPVPAGLVVAPAARAVAWVFNDRGRQNVWIAEGRDLHARQLTAFTEDDGQPLGELAWTPDGRAVLFVRGGAADGAGNAPNPASDVEGATQDVWIAPLDGKAARRIGPGHSPAVSPRGDAVAFIRRGEVWTASTRDQAPPRRMFAARGQAAQLEWSPDGSSLAFVAMRGAHSLVAIFHTGRRSLEYVSPAVDRDLFPRWSPDARQIAFVRMENTAATMRSTGRFGAIDSPWAVMVATRPAPGADFGAAVEVWRPPAKPLGSFPRNVQMLEWVKGGRLVTASEHEDWAHLYLIDPAAPGSAPRLLTPGGCEVDDAVVGAGRQTIVYASNCGDLERRHLWKVAVPTGAAAAEPPHQLTAGAGVETAPAALSDGDGVAFFKSDWRTPVLPHVLSLADRTSRPLAANAIPASFSREQLIEPQLAVFKAADGLEIHAPVFGPRTEGAGAPRRAPALIHVHGGPTNGQALLGWQPIFQHLASRGFVVLGLNYRGGAGYGRLFRELRRQGGEGAIEYQDVVAAAQYLRSRPDVDPARIGIWGNSYGGYLTQLALARNSDLFAAGVSECGIFDLSANPNANNVGNRGGEATRIARESSAVGSIDNWRSPVLLIHGDADLGVDFNLQTVTLARALRGRGVPFEQLVFPDEGHGLSVWAHVLRAHQATADFFERKLGSR